MRDKIEKAFRQIEAEAEQFGVELLTKKETFIDDEHLDPIWYGGYIGGFKYKGYEVSIEVCGDVDVSGSVNGREFLYRNKANTGAMNLAAADTLRTAFKSDAELWAAQNADDDTETRVEFLDNNWIEAFVKDPKGHWHGSSVVDDADDVLDACGDISAWIEWLEENYIQEV